MNLTWLFAVGTAAAVNFFCLVTGASIFGFDFSNIGTRSGSSGGRGGSVSPGGNKAKTRGYAGSYASDADYGAYDDAGADTYGVIGGYDPVYEGYDRKDGRGYEDSIGGAQMNQRFAYVSKGYERDDHYGGYHDDDHYGGGSKGKYKYKSWWKPRGKGKEKSKSKGNGNYNGHSTCHVVIEHKEHTFHHSPGYHRK